MPQPTGKRGAVELQERDFELLTGLLESRLMTLDHACRLYFDGRGEAAKKRLQQLRAAGFVGERPRERPYQPLILFLTRTGFQELINKGLPHHYPPLTWDSLEKRVRVADSTLRHEIDVMNVKAAMTAAVNKHPDLEVVEFSTWPVLYQFTAKRPDRFGSSQELPVRPDGFIRIIQRLPPGDRGFEHMFFLEVDRSTETQERVASQAACYRDYFHSGRFAERFGRSREHYKDIPFRVLMVFRNAERRNNTAVQLLKIAPPILTMAWLTTTPALEAAPLGCIWIRPADYRTATNDTTYAPEREPEKGPYRRRPDREAFVESAVPKHALIEE